MAALPIVSDMTTLLARLRGEERDRRAEVARLEARLREFEDVERPAYARWVRLELGPTLVALEARREELRTRESTVERAFALAAREGWEPREALWMIQQSPERTTSARRDRMDPDEVAARRRAKVERKRADRKAARRAQRETAAPSAPAGTPRADRVTVYRAVARRLHPDSPTLVRSLDPSRVKTLWVEAHAAYASGDLDRLLAIATWLDAEGDGDTAAVMPSSLSERYERLRALARSARMLERRLAEHVVDPAWDFSSRSVRDRKRMRTDAARMLDDERERVEGAWRELTDLFDEIGTPRPPRGRR